MTRRRILFLSENVTWSQVVRLLVLARGVDRRRFEPHFACARFDTALFGPEAPAGPGDVPPLRHWNLGSIDKAKMEAALVSGARLYEASVLQGYVDEERRLFDTVQPDLIVSDLRWSTTISAPLAGLPCATMVDAFWSPHVARQGFPLPDHPIIKLVGLAMAEKYFPVAQPKVFAHFAAPVNKLRKRHKLPELGSLQDVMLWGDRVLFPDDPALVPMVNSPDHHRFLGPIAWNPPVPPPPGFEALGVTRPLLYVTLGSSGPAAVVPTVVSALATLDVDVVLSTAGKPLPSSVKIPDNIHIVDVAPGDRLARKAALVICNGGASTGYQALAEGTPLVGIPSNLDQYLAMTAMESAGVGRLLRAGLLTADAVREAVVHVLAEPSYREAAARIGRSFQGFDPVARFSAIADELFAEKTGPAGAAPVTRPLR
jgi:UDP:flavonoid glycosyltransferase YjiC (YdhE family)